MTTTAVATESTQGLGGRRVRLMAGALVAFLCVFTYAVAAPGHARAAGPVSAPVPAIPGVSDATAGAAGADEPALTSLAPSSEPAPTDQTASTQQSASSAASAVQQQPQNIVISIRINSPGNDAPITQINASVGAAASSNGSATGQSAGSGAGSGQQGGNQNASTTQAADSNASSAQNQPQNTVISIRINSPGNNGAIVQQNLTVSVSSSGNVSITGQQQGPPEVSADESGTKAPLTAAPMNHGTRQIKTGGGTSSAKAAPPWAPKASTAAAEPASGGSKPAGAWHAATSRSAAPVVTATKAVRHTLVAATHRLIPRQMAGAARHFATVPHNAADVLKNLAPPPPVPASDGGQNVSSVVLLTLVAVLGAFAVLFGSSLMGHASQTFGRWNWRLR